MMEENRNGENKDFYCWIKSVEESRREDVLNGFQKQCIQLGFSESVARACLYQLEILTLRVVLQRTRMRKKKENVAKSFKGDVTDKPVCSHRRESEEKRSDEIDSCKQKKKENVVKSSTEDTDKPPSSHKRKYEENMSNKTDSSKKKKKEDDVKNVKHLKKNQSSSRYRKRPEEKTSNQTSNSKTVTQGNHSLTPFKLPKTHGTSVETIHRVVKTKRNVNKFKTSSEKFHEKLSNNNKKTAHKKNIIMSGKQNTTVYFTRNTPSLTPSEVDQSWEELGCTPPRTMSSAFWGHQYTPRVTEIVFTLAPTEVPLSIKTQETFLKHKNVTDVTRNVTVKSPVIKKNTNELLMPLKEDCEDVQPTQTGSTVLNLKEESEFDQPTQTGSPVLSLVQHVDMELVGSTKSAGIPPSKSECDTQKTSQQPLSIVQSSEIVGSAMETLTLLKEKSESDQPTQTGSPVLNLKEETEFYQPTQTGSPVPSLVQDVDMELVGSTKSAGIPPSKSESDTQETSQQPLSIVQSSEIVGSAMETLTLLKEKSESNQPTQTGSPVLNLVQHVKMELVGSTWSAEIPPSKSECDTQKTSQQPLSIVQSSEIVGSAMETLTLLKEKSESDQPTQTGSPVLNLKEETEFYQPTQTGSPVLSLVQHVDMEVVGSTKSAGIPRSKSESDTQETSQQPLSIVQSSEIVGSAKETLTLLKEKSESDQPTQTGSPVLNLVQHVKMELVGLTWSAEIPPSKSECDTQKTSQQPLSIVQSSEIVGSAMETLTLLKEKSESDQPTQTGSPVLNLKEETEFYQPTQTGSPVLSLVQHVDMELVGSTKSAGIPPSKSESDTQETSQQPLSIVQSSEILGSAMETLTLLKEKSESDQPTQTGSPVLNLVQHVKMELVGSTWSAEIPPSKSECDTQKTSQQPLSIVQSSEIVGSAMETLTLLKEKSESDQPTQTGSPVLNLKEETEFYQPTQTGSPVLSLVQHVDMELVGSTKSAGIPPSKSESDTQETSQQPLSIVQSSEILGSAMETLTLLKEKSESDQPTQTGSPVLNLVQHVKMELVGLTWSAEIPPSKSECDTQKTSQQPLSIVQSSEIVGSAMETLTLLKEKSESDQPTQTGSPVLNLKEETEFYQPTQTGSPVLSLVQHVDMELVGSTKSAGIPPSKSECDTQKTSQQPLSIVQSSEIVGSAMETLTLLKEKSESDQPTQTGSPVLNLKEETEFYQPTQTGSPVLSLVQHVDMVLVGSTKSAGIPPSKSESDTQETSQQPLFILQVPEIVGSAMEALTPLEEKSKFDQPTQTGSPVLNLKEETEFYQPTQTGSPVLSLVQHVNMELVGSTKSAGISPSKSESDFQETSQQPLSIVQSPKIVRPAMEMFRPLKEKSESDQPTQTGSPVLNLVQCVNKELIWSANSTEIAPHKLVSGNSDVISYEFTEYPNKSCDSIMKFLGREKSSMSELTADILNTMKQNKDLGSIDDIAVAGQSDEKNLVLFALTKLNKNDALVLPTNAVTRPVGKVVDLHPPWHTEKPRNTMSDNASIASMATQYNPLTAKHSSSYDDNASIASLSTQYNPYTLKHTTLRHHPLPPTSSISSTSTYLRPQLSVDNSEKVFNYPALYKKNTCERNIHVRNAHERDTHEKDTLVGLRYDRTLRYPSQTGRDSKDQRYAREERVRHPLKTRRYYRERENADRCYGLSDRPGLSRNPSSHPYQSRSHYHEQENTDGNYGISDRPGLSRNPSPPNYR